MRAINDLKLNEFRSFAKEQGLRGYSKLRKAELITLIQNNVHPPCTRPPKPTRPRPPPPPPALHTRPPPPVRPRQPEFKPYHLKPKRGKETFIEPPVEQSPMERSPSSNLNRSNV